MVSDLSLPCGPVVRRVLAPDVQLVWDPLPREQRGEPLGRVECAGRVLPRASPDDEDEVNSGAEPVEVLAVQVGDVVERVVEIEAVAAVTPPDARDVVQAGHTKGEREDVRTAQ